MTSAIHFINKRDAKGDLKRLTRLDDGTFRTCCWAISQGEAERLHGGWVYLHEAKNEPSRFGGKVIGVEQMKLPEFAHEDRFAFRFAPHPAAKKTIWRGASHGMAWSGGVIAADLDHEIV